MIEPTWPAPVESVLSQSVKAVALAGAGTGKTTFATEKVRREVARGEIDIESVVCITFTRDAAGELKDRVRQSFLDAFHVTGEPRWHAQAQAISLAPMGTIHALALRLLQDHPLEAGIDLTAEVIEADEASRLLGEAIDGVLRERIDADPSFAALVEPYRWRDRGFQAGLGTSLTEACQLWVERGAPTDILERVAEHWPHARELGLAFADCLRKSYERYVESKRGRLDFDDLVRRANRLLHDHPEIRRRLQSRVRLLVLDEAQDTDAAQMDLVTKLSGRRSGGERWPDVDLAESLIAVGDLKQAIYGFRGADQTQFALLIDKVREQGGWEVPLTENRRCHPAIVDFVNDLSASLYKGTSHYRPERDALVAKRQVAPGGPPRIWRIEHDAKPGEKAEELRGNEARDIARTIRWFVDPDKSPVTVHDRDDHPPRVPRLGDIALLFGVTSNLEIYTAALRAHGIPFHVQRGRGYFSTPEVRDAMALLRAIQNPCDRLAFAELIRCPISGLSDDDLLLAWEWADLRWDRAASKLRKNRSDKVPDRLADLIRRLVRAHARKDRVPIAQLLTDWWDATGYRAFLAAGALAVQRLANLNKLLDLARRHQDHDQGTLRSFIDRLLELSENNQEPQANAVGARENVVRILTAHQSKGLEFRVVFVCDSARMVDWMTSPPVAYDPDIGLVGKVPGETGTLESTPSYNRWKDAEKTRILGDQSNLLYVAATRARDVLVFAGNHGITKTGNARRVTCWRNWIENSEADRHVQVVRSEEIEDVGPPPASDRWRPPLSTDEAWSLPAEEPSASARALVARLSAITTPPCTIVHHSVTQLVSIYALDHGDGEVVDIEAVQPWSADAEDPELAPESVGTLLHALVDAWEFDAPMERDTMARIVRNLGHDPDRPRLRRLLDALGPFLAEQSTRLAGRRSRIEAQLREFPVEIQLEREGKSLVARGTCDLAYLADDGWHLVDYKSGRRAHQKAYSFQLKAYALAMTQAGYAPIVDAELWYVESRDPRRWVVGVDLAGVTSKEMVDSLWSLSERVESEVDRADDP